MNNTLTVPPVLDACCGSRMFWFNRRDVRALFVDKRRENCTADTREGRREIVVDPDVIADFKALPTHFSARTPRMRHAARKPIHHEHYQETPRNDA